MTTAQFEKQLNEVQAKLFGFALKLTKNESDANDLFQETAFKAFKNKDRFEMGSNFKSWTTTIMYNSFVNEYRKKKRRNLASAPIEDLAYALPNTNMPDANSRISEENIQNAIDGLKEKYKSVFKMHVDGFKYKEIAKKAQLPIGTVKSRISTARNVLKVDLSQYKTA